MVATLKSPSMSKTKKSAEHDPDEEGLRSLIAEAEARPKPSSLDGQVKCSPEFAADLQAIAVYAKRLLGRRVGGFEILETRIGDWVRVTAILARKLEYEASKEDGQ